LRPRFFFGRTGVRRLPVLDFSLKGRQNREYECSRNPHGRTRSTYGTALEFTSYYVSNTVLEFSTRHSTVCCMRSKCNTVVTLRSYVRLRERPRETKNAL